MNDDDRQLDAGLRRVSLPEHLRAALTPDTLFADAAIDRLLGAGAAPPGLADRVQAAARASDTPTRNGVVDLTRFATGRGERPAPDRPVIGSGRRAGGGLRMMREASRVAVALGLAFLLATAGIQMSRWLEGPGASGGAVAARGPQRRHHVGPPTVRRDDPASTPGAGGAAAAEATGVRLGKSGGQPTDRNEPERAVAAVARETPPAPAHDASDLAWRLPAPAEPLTVRGATVGLGEVTALTVVELPRDARRQVPKSAAFDLGFEMTHGESPFVNPAADSSLAVDRPPLTLGTDGFDRLVRGEADRRPLASATRIRAEEVLAAMPPPPELVARGTEPVRLGLVAVPSGRKLDGRPTVFLEATAYAAGPRRGHDAPLRATLILDQAAAGDPMAWPRICRGLGAVAAGLDPLDRISVVICGPRPRVAVRDAPPDALAAAAGNWETLPAAASSDLDAAVAAAREAGLLGDRTVVVAHGATLDRCRGDVRELLSSWHRALALTGGDPLASTPTEGMRFVVLDPSTPAPDRDAGPTFGRTGIDAVAIRRALLRQVTGDDTLVARQCSLEVRFDPRRVAAYRLIGHRQSVVESLADASPAAIDLHAGETVRAVYEVVPKQNGTIGLATARLSWRTPEGAPARLEASDRDAG
ncbi:MAG: YfbK domain-containing protein, partial [Planctomycetota bacterium]